MVYVKTYSPQEIPFDEGEAMRYFGYGKGKSMPPEEVKTLFSACAQEALAASSYRVAYAEFPVKYREGGILDLSFTQTSSKSLKLNLEGCHKVIAFAATVGVGIDRLICRYERSSPSKAYAFQAIGAERAESLCNVFNGEMSEKLKAEGEFTRPRFSCGYGDFPLEKQRDFFAALDCNRKIGLTLNDSLLMSPSKSVTALIGVAKTACRHASEKCALCYKTDCVFRK
jgi:hypothetical protein